MDSSTRYLGEVDDLRVEEEWEPRRSGGANVLWGRVFALGIALVFVFLIGRISAPNGVPRSQLDSLQQQLAASHRQLTALQSELDRAQRAAARPAATPSPQPSASPSAPAPAASGSKGITYKVQSGDTLYSIASKFYGDSSFADFIAESNNLGHSGRLLVGQKLTIPPKP